MTEQQDQGTHKFGKLVPPFPIDTCASASCPSPLLTEETEAFLFTDVETGKLIELHRADRWRLVML